MSSFDPIEALNQISEVIINRPKPIREFDQIYMRAGDMLLQTEHISKLFQDKEVAFIGDGDSISLCSIYLNSRGVITHGPKRVHVLDFDERIVNAVKAFAKRFDLENRISAEWYNVANPLPTACWESFDAFYTNPPFGESNGGKSIEAFLQRGIETLKSKAVATVVIADDLSMKWTQEILSTTQQYMSEKGFHVSELLPAFHTYHLEDNPNLKSCSISFRTFTKQLNSYNSQALSKSMLSNFYGRGLPLTVSKIQDNLIAEKTPSKDYNIIPI